MENFIVLTRYEYLSTKGKVWSKWFVRKSNPMTKEEAENYINEVKKNFEFIDKKTKLRHEYMLQDYEVYIQKINELNSKIKKLTEAQKNYYSSNEHKELLRKKRQSKKELYEHQQKYKELLNM